MPRKPAPAEPRRDAAPAGEFREPVPSPDPWSEEEWLAWCQATAGQDEPPPEEEEPDPVPAEDFDPDTVLADWRRASADEAALAAQAWRRGLPAGQPIASRRRGPGQPGSAARIPGDHPSRAAGFGAGMLLDTLPGCNALAGFAAEAAGEDDRYDGASDDEVAGAIAAWDRLEAHVSARKHAAIAEFTRRRPGPGASRRARRRCRRPGMSSPSMVALLLGESRGTAEGIMTLARDLEVKLPGTKEAFRDGLVRESKASIIAAATALLDEKEARAAEALVLGRAARLTPAGRRAAVARAVMEVAPAKARKRREEAAKDARVQRWAEDSGNAALMGRELNMPRGAVTGTRRQAPSCWRAVVDGGLPAQVSSRVVMSAAWNAARASARSLPTAASRTGLLRIACSWSRRAACAAAVSWSLRLVPRWRAASSGTP